MKKFFDEKYKKNLINDIKSHITSFKIKLVNENVIFFYPYKTSVNNEHAKNKLIIKTMVLIWIITILVIALTTVSKDFVTELIFDININYVLIFFFVIIILFLKTIYCTKRIHKMILCDKYLKLYTAPIIKKNTKKHLKESSYLLSNIDFYVQSRRSTIKDNMRNNSTHFYLFYNEKRKKFLIKFRCEEEFFAFLLTLKNTMGKLNISSLSDDELYEMYHTRSYGLPLSTKS